MENEKICNDIKILVQYNGEVVYKHITSHALQCLDVQGGLQLFLFTIILCSYEFIYNYKENNERDNLVTLMLITIFKKRK